MAETFCKLIDTINEWSGRIAAWLFIPLTIGVTVDVFTRYVLNKPWFYLDINVQIMGTLVLLGAGYCLLHGKHIEMDMFVTRLSPRKRAIMRLILYPLFFVGVGVLLWKVTVAAMDSLRLHERYTSAFGPPIYPYKVIIVIGVLLLLLQGISIYIRDLKTVFTPNSEGKP